MSQTEQSNLPFDVVKVDITTGETFFKVQKGIIGALANQLKDTTNRRSGGSILRKLGHKLADCGDIQYGSRNVDETEIDPSRVISE